MNSEEIALRVLDKNDKPALDALIKEIESSLVRQEFWLPILGPAYEHFFDETWTLFCGAFYKNRLIGASALFFNPFEYRQSADKINLSSDKIVEVGRCMVSPKYRGNNLMLKMNKFLLSINPKSVEYYIATAHPENFPSAKSLQSLGFEKKGSLIKSNFARDIYLLEIKS